MGFQATPKPLIRLPTLWTLSLNYRNHLKSQITEQASSLISYVYINPSS